jgi:hypothetical protein
VAVVVCFWIEERLRLRCALELLMPRRVHRVLVDVAENLLPLVKHEAEVVCEVEWNGIGSDAIVNFAKSRFIKIDCLTTPN